MFVSEFLKALLIKAGVNVSDEALKPFLENAELAKIEIPLPAATGIDNNLISIDAAKDGHPAIKNHYHAQALNGIDTLLEGEYANMGLSQDDINELKLERSTGKRAKLMMEKVREIEKKKVGAKGPETKALQDQIEALHAQVRSEKAGRASTIAEYAQKDKQRNLATKVSRLLTKNKTIYDTTLDPDTRDMTLNAVIENRLASKGAKLDFDEHGQLILLKLDGSKYFGENNQLVNPEQFFEQTLADKNILVVNGVGQQQIPGAPAQNTPGQQAPIIATDTPGAKKTLGQNSVWNELIGQSIEDQKKNGVPVPTV